MRRHVHTLMLLLLLSAVLSAQDPAPLPADLAAWIERYRDDKELLENRYRLASSDRFERLLAFHGEALLRLRRSDFESLSQDDRITFHLADSGIRRTIADLEDERDLFEECAPLLPFHGVLTKVEETVRESSPWFYEALAADMERATKDAESVTGVKPAPDPDPGPESASSRAETAPAADMRPLLLRSVRHVKFVLDVATADRSYLEGFLNDHAAFDPLFHFWLKAPSEKLEKSLAALKKHLDEKILDDLKKSRKRNLFARGRERFARDLETERIPMTPDSLLAFGEERFAEIERELEAEARKIDPAKTWQECLALVKEDHVGPGEQRLFVADLAREVIRFIEEKRLFAVPSLSKECWSLTPISSEGQKKYPFAYYSGNAMAVAFATGEMDQDRKAMAMRGNNRHFTRTVTPHELIPGHHMQGFYAKRFHPERRHFASSFFIEGWGFYTELLLDENGWFRTPRERMGHLFWKLLRAARILVSTRYHLEEMTTDEMTSFLTARAGLEKSNAEAEVERYMTYSPLYQASYMVGAWQIRDLRDEARRALGAAFDPIAFHETLLRQGSIPLALARFAVLGLPVPREVR